MTRKFCPHCQEFGETKVKGSGYSQIKVRDTAVKKRMIIHRIEDGGCGQIWFSYELPENLLKHFCPELFGDYPAI